MKLIAKIKLICTKEQNRSLLKTLEQCNKMIDDSNRDTVYLVEYGGSIYNSDAHATMLKRSINYTNALRKHRDMLEKWEGPYAD